MCLLTACRFWRCSLFVKRSFAILRRTKRPEPSPDVVARAMRRSSRDIGGCSPGRPGCASRPYRAGGSFGMTTHELPTGASVRHLSGPSIWKPDPRSLLALPATLLAPPLCGVGSWCSIGRILRLGASELHHAVCMQRPFSKRAPPRCRLIRIVAGGDRDKATLSR